MWPWFSDGSTKSWFCLFSFFLVVRMPPLFLKHYRFSHPLHWKSTCQSHQWPLLWLLSQFLELLLFDLFAEPDRADHSFLQTGRGFQDITLYWFSYLTVHSVSAGSSSLPWPLSMWSAPKLSLWTSSKQLTPLVIPSSLMALNTTCMLTSTFTSPSLNYRIQYPTAHLTSPLR